MEGESAGMEVGPCRGLGCGGERRVCEPKLAVVGAHPAASTFSRGEWFRGVSGHYDGITFEQCSEKFGLALRSR